MTTLALGQHEKTGQVSSKNCVCVSRCENHFLLIAFCRCKKQVLKANLSSTQNLVVGKLSLAFLFHPSNMWYGGSILEGPGRVLWLAKGNVWATYLQKCWGKETAGNHISRQSREAHEPGELATRSPQQRVEEARGNVDTTCGKTGTKTCIFARKTHNDTQHAWSLLGNFDSDFVNCTINKGKWEKIKKSLSLHKSFYVQLAFPCWQNTKEKNLITWEI